MLSFQRLDVYQRGLELLSFVSKVDFPRGLAPVADQLRRAAVSIPLNIAEAAGRNTKADAARHYAIARGSAMECAAILDSLRVLGVIEPTEYEHGTTLAARIVAMCTKLCR